MCGRSCDLELALADDVVRKGVEPLSVSKSRMKWKQELRKQDVIALVQGNVIRLAPNFLSKKYSRP